MRQLTTMHAMAKTAKKKPRVPASPGQPTVGRRSVPAPQRRGSAASPRYVYAIALAAAFSVGTLLIALSLISVHRPAASPSESSGSGSGIAGIAASSALFAGIPQKGNVLGWPSAPVTIVEYADLQCPYCGEFARNVLPALVTKYVRTRKVRFVFKGLAFIGPDSISALNAAAAAGRQNRLWNVVDLLYANQGAENTGWVTDRLLRDVTSAAGANPARVFAARNGSRVRTLTGAWERSAQTRGVKATPSFFFGSRGRPLQPLAITQLAPSQFEAAIEGQLAP